MATIPRSLERSWAVLLTTYRRDGTAVGTAVNLAVEEDRAYFRTYATAGKVKRLARRPAGTVAPCTARGRPTGEAVAGTARLLEGDQVTVARHALANRHPVFQRFVVPTAHRLARYRTLHYEVQVGSEGLSSPGAAG